MDIYGRTSLSLILVLVLINYYSTYVRKKEKEKINIYHSLTSCIYDLFPQSDIYNKVQLTYHYIKVIDAMTYFFVSRTTSIDIFYRKIILYNYVKLIFYVYITY